LPGINDSFTKTNNLRSEEFMITHIRKVLALGLSSTLLLSGCGTGLTLTPLPVVPTVTSTTAQAAIKHVVVIFPENISFDHYFGTYPNAANLPSDKVQFTAATGTPTPDNYVTNPSLLTANPNLNLNNNASADASPGSNGYPSIASNPFRLDINQAATADQDHAYGPEQLAFDDGKMDLFPLSVGASDQGYGTLAATTDAPAAANTNALTMGYFDGNTVTGMWNYAQHYSLNDHSFGTTFGASTQGAINLISGQTNGAVADNTGGATEVVADGNGGFTDIGDADPTGDICSSTTTSIHMTGKNIGDLLNAANVTWGWFQGGFNLTITNSNGTTGCKRSTTSAVTHVTEGDYIQHHQPFQYYATTQNLNHTRPTAGVAIGAADPKGANHQYDIQDFNTALAAGNMPAVSFLKAPGYQDGHAGYSDPIDEQNFVVSEINAIEASPLWSSTAIIIAYDDSDGWYDHVSNFVNGSKTASDAAFCNGTSPTRTGVTSGTTPVQGLCGFGPRLPLLVISPWAKANYIDSTVTDQSSVIRFIEDVFLPTSASSTTGTRIGGGSYDAEAGTLDNMFNFTNAAAPPSPNNLQLNPSTGVVASTTAP
jgi:phospholipase C